MTKPIKRLTTKELAELLGVTRQTVNRWIREFGWQTEKQSGVKGGRARYVLITKEVENMLKCTPAMRQHHIVPTSLADPAAPYISTNRARERINHTLDLMTQEQTDTFDLFLRRAGLNGLFALITPQQLLKE